MRLQTRLTGLLIMISIATWCGAARCELIVYEPFDYPAGTVLAGTAATGLNLAGNYETTSTFPDQFQLTARSPGLNYGNLIGAPSPHGNSLTEPSGTTSGDATVSVDSDVLVGPGQSLYWSALFTLNSATNGNRFASITFMDDDNGDLLQFGEGIGVRSIRIAAHTASTGQLIATGADPSFSDGDTLLLIGRYINSAVPDGDRLDLIGYNTADADVLPLSFEPTDPHAEFAYELENLDIDFEKITSITFTIRGDDNNFIDELRIGSTYTAVIPEPTAIAFFVIAACAAAVVGRVKRRERG